jgi:pyruvate dehydrogenase E2 component (dihydrolipoamide acetyltransferase)
MIKDITIPEISENVTSGTVVAVLVKSGDAIDVEDPVIEFETDKAVVEIPSSYKGKITDVLVKEGDEKNVGDTIAKIDTEADSTEEEGREKREGGEAEPVERVEEKPEREPGEGGARKEKAEPAEEKEEGAFEERKEKEAAEEEGEKEEKPAEKEAEGEPEKKGSGGPPREKAEAPTPVKAAEDSQEEKTRKVQDERLRAEAQTRGPAPASPSVRRFARELGVDIHAVPAAGPGERISEEDVKAHVRKLRSAADKREGAGSGPAGLEQPALPDFSRWGAVETRELTGVRRLTAESMSTAWQTVVHVTQFEKADITDMLQFMERHADSVAERGGKLTVTAVLMKVCAAALKRFPRFNASIDPANQRLILKKYIHIGLAVDTGRGLLVPVVRDADQKTITELAVEIVDLAKRARNKKITPDEMEGGSFTISNQGGIGGTDFTPVVFWPQAAILGVSRATTVPRYIGAEFQPRKVLPLALSYDHRIVDGADAARFTRWIRDSLEYPMTMQI